MTSRPAITVRVEFDHPRRSPETIETDLFLPSPDPLDGYREWPMRCSVTVLDALSRSLTDDLEAPARFEFDLLEIGVEHVRQIGPARRAGLPHTGYDAGLVDEIVVMVRIAYDVGGAVVRDALVDYLVGHVIDALVEHRRAIAEVGAFEVVRRRRRRRRQT
jgi:hypothetical protein